MKRVQPVTPNSIHLAVHTLFVKVGLIVKGTRKRYELRSHSIRKFFRTKVDSGPVLLRVDFYLTTTVYRNNVPYASRPIPVPYQGPHQVSNAPPPFTLITYTTYPTIPNRPFATRATNKISELTFDQLAKKLPSFRESTTQSDERVLIR